MQCNQVDQIDILEPETVKCFGPVTVVTTEAYFESFKCLCLCIFYFILVVIH